MAGSTNFLQWNPGAANQETDAQYTSDSQRTGGAPQGSIFPSELSNKIFYQLTTMVAALAQSLANKGYNLNDSNISTLEGVLSNIVTFVDLKTNMITVPYSPTPVFNAASTNAFRFNIQGNVTSSTMVGHQFGQIITYVLQMNGPFTFAWPSNVLGAYTVSPANVQPSNVYVQSFIVLEDGNAYTLPSEIQVLINQLAGINASITSLNGTVGSLQTQITNNYNQIQSQFNAQNAENSNLQTQITNNYNQIQSQLNTKQNNLGFTPVQQGGGSGQAANKIFIGWSGSRLKGQVDTTDLGNIVFDATMNAAISAAISAALANLFQGSFALPGYIHLGGLIIQWAQGSTDSGQNVPGQTINFPIAFPNNCFVVIPSTVYLAGNSDTNIFVYILNGTPNRSQAFLYRQRRGDQSNATTYPYIIAVGN